MNKTSWDLNFNKPTSKITLVGPSAGPEKKPNIWLRSIISLIVSVIIIAGAVVLALYLTGRFGGKDLLKETLNEISSNINEKIDPCDDFYEYACGGFLSKHPMNELSYLKSEINHFTIEAEKLRDKIIDVLEGDLLKDGNKAFQYVKRIWDSCMKPEDQDSMEKLKDFLSLIDTAYSLEDAIMVAIKHGYKVFFDIKTITGKASGYRTTVSIDKPDLKLTAAMTNGYKTPLFEHYLDIMSLYNNKPDAKFRLEAMVLFEQQLLENSTSFADRLFNPTKYNFVKSYSQLENQGFNWKHMIANISWKYPENTDIVIVHDPLYLENFEKENFNKSDAFLKEYIKFSILEQSCARIEKCRNLMVKFAHNYSRNETTDNIKKSICFNSMVDLKLDPLLTKIAYPQYELMKQKSDVHEMMSSMNYFFHQFINESSWIDSTTKSSAFSALANLNGWSSELGMPYWAEYDIAMVERYTEYPHINSTERNQVSFFEYSKDILNYELEETYKVLRGQSGTYNRHWPIATTSTTPFFEPWRESLYIPGRSMKGFFFDSKFPSFMKFGLLGTVVGHEITHAFDAVADSYKSTSYSKFWSDVTRKNFNSRMQCLVEKYDKFVTHYDGFINGTTTLNENLADHISLEVLYRTFVNSTKDPVDLPAGPLRGLNDEQLFFVSYANTHCSQDLVQAMVDFKLGNRSPRRARVNIPVSQMPEFAKAFKCPSNSKMNPNERCYFK